MGLEEVYDPKLRIIYPETTDSYLVAIPAVETMNILADLAKNPAAIEGYVRQALEANEDAARDIETSRYAIACRASVIRELLLEHSGLLAELPAEVKAQMEEWASRIQGPEAQK